MLKKSLMVSALTGALALTAGYTLAADQVRAQDQTQDRTQDRIYGSQLMTQQERADFRSRMRAAKTAKEREQIRKEHHDSMKVRAKERGVTLPDEPPARGGGMMGPGGMGPGGGGMGPGGGGMGPGGGGMGPGGSRNR